MAVSMLHGWFPWTLRIVAAIVVVLATGWRDGRWRTRWVPLAAGTAVVTAVVSALAVPAVMALVDPVPIEVWVWVAVFVFVVFVLVVGWTGGPWWRRAASLVAVLLAAATAGNAINVSVGYYPMLDDTWADLAHTSLPSQIDLSEIGSVPRGVSTGRVVRVTIPDTLSHFPHRQEFVYLPPAWFRARPRPRLPVLEMIGGQFTTPDNWIRAGNAVATADAYAQRHGGLAPILVFADATGHFHTDTECVNGAAGNAEDHLVKDIPAYLESAFGAASSPRSWGVVGWSMGGTCAIDLVVEHPDVTGRFVDISGDLGPNLGSKQNTIARLYNGNAAAWAAHDPLTVLAHHEPYQGVSGLFVNGDAEKAHIKQADQLAAAARRAGIDAQLVIRPGGHTWSFAAQAFADSLPWLTIQLGLGP